MSSSCTSSPGTSSSRNLELLVDRLPRFLLWTQVLAAYHHDWGMSTLYRSQLEALWECSAATCTIIGVGLFENTGAPGSRSTGEALSLEWRVSRCMPDMCALDIHRAFGRVSQSCC